MTAIAYTPSFDIVQFCQLTNGVSSEAFTVANATESTLQQINDTVSSTPRSVSVINQLLRVQQECSSDNWDGYGACRVDPRTLDNAKGFMGDLDTFLPAPDICPEPDGEVALEWFGDLGSTISISIGIGDIVSYAAIFPDQHKVNGTDSLENEDKGIIETYIRKVTGTI